MAMIRVEPVEVRVRADWFDGRPREVTWGDRRLPVTGLAAVRDESSAYPGHHRPANVLRGRDAARPPRPHLPAPLAALDRRGPRRGRPAWRPDRSNARRRPSLPRPVYVGSSGRVRRYRAAPSRQVRAQR